MATWKEFAERARESKAPWHVKLGRAHIHQPNGNYPFVGYVRIYAPPTTLDLTHHRITHATSERDVTFEIYTVRDANGFNHPEDQAAMMDIWSSLWRGIGHFPIPKTARIPMKGFREPSPLHWMPAHRAIFPRYAISKTHLAPLWGQDAPAYCERPVMELNAGEHLGVDIARTEHGAYPIAYRQEWVSRLACPFCFAQNLNWVVVWRLFPTEANFFGTADLPCACPKCERIVETVPFDVVARGGAPLAKPLEKP
jgi:hypothetical protein